MNVLCGLIERVVGMRTVSKRAAAWAVAFAFVVFAAMPAVAAEPLSLSDALKQAEANNPGLQVAKQNLKSARASLEQAYLQLSIRGSYDNGRAVLPPYDWVKTTSVGANYGQLFSVDYLWTSSGDEWAVNFNPFSLSELLTILRARVDYQDSEVKYRSQLEELRYNVTNAYCGVLQSDALQALAERSLSAVNRAYEDGMAKEKAGLMARADLMRLQTALYQQRAALMQSRANSQLARATLAGLLGVQMSSISTLSAPPEAQDEQFDQDAITRAALQNRGEVALADARVGLAKFGVVVARVSPLKGVSVQWVPDQKISVGVSIPIGSTLGGIQSADATLESVKLAAKIQRDSITLEAMKAYLAVITARGQLEFMRLAMESAQEVARVTALRYDAGLATVAEKLDADVSAQQAEQQYVQAQYNLLLAEAQVQKATWGM